MEILHDFDVIKRPVNDLIIKYGYCITSISEEILFCIYDYIDGNLRK